VPQEKLQRSLWGKAQLGTEQLLKALGFLEPIKTSQDQPYFQPDERGVNLAAHKEFKNINV